MFSNVSWAVSVKMVHPEGKLTGECCFDFMGSIIILTFVVSYDLDCRICDFSRHGCFPQKFTVVTVGGSPYTYSYDTLELQQQHGGRNRSFSKIWTFPKWKNEKFPKWKKWIPISWKINLHADFKKASFQGWVFWKTRASEVDLQIFCCWASRKFPSCQRYLPHGGKNRESTGWLVGFELEKKRGNLMRNIPANLALVCSYGTW